MNKLYIAADLSDIIHIIYTYIEPLYSCQLIKKPNPAANLASTSKAFNKIRHTHCPEVYKDKCCIQKKIKKLCQTHCKAYPIYDIIYQKSQISNLQYHRQYEYHKYYKNVCSKDYMHFTTKYIARFAPHILTNIKFLNTCCTGSGWAWNWRKPTKNKKQHTTILPPSHLGRQNFTLLQYNPNPNPNPHSTNPHSTNPHSTNPHSSDPDSSDSSDSSDDNTFNEEENWII